MACSGLIKCTTKRCFSELLGIVTKVLVLVWISCRCTYTITGRLPEDDRLDSSHVAGLDDNN